MSAFCFFRSSSSRWTAARRLSASASTSARACVPSSLAWAMISSALRCASDSSFLASSSASRLACSARWTASAARCSASAARRSASSTSWRGGSWAAGTGSASPPAGLLDQLAGGLLGVGQALDLLTVGLLATGRDLDLEVGLGLGPQRLGLLEQELLAPADVVGLAPGGADE